MSSKAATACWNFIAAGNFTLPMAKVVANVVAVEGYRPALANAKLNAQKYGLENIRWSGESVPVALGGLKTPREFYQNHPRPDAQRRQRY